MSTLQKIVRSCFYFERAHTGEVPYECLECGKRFKSSSHFAIHKKIDRKERNDCKICGKLLSSSANFKKSMKKHMKTKIPESNE